MAAKLLKNNHLSIQQARADLQIVDQIVSAIKNNAMTITAWEASGRYDLHVVTKITTIKKYSRIIWDWYDNLFSKGYR